MVGIVSGIRAGLELGSREVLGQAGQIGNPAEGRNGQGVYVNVATGNLVVQNRDELLVGHGEDAVAVRTYNSLGQFSDENGDRWRTGTASLQLTSVLNAWGSSITRTGFDGSSAVYVFDGTRYVTAEGSGAFDTIRYLAAENQFEWTDGATQVTQRYEGSGAMRLLSCKDPSGNVLAYLYDASGFLSVVATATDKTTYEYAGANLTRLTTTGVGFTTTRVRYEYDASNRLTGVIVDLSPDDNTTTDGNVYRTGYTYEADSRRIATITQGDGSSLAFTYVDAGGGNFRVASVRDGLGQVTTFNYYAGFTAVTDGQGLVTRYDVDAQGQLTAITPLAVGASTAVQQFAYSASGDVISVTDGEGRKVVFDYGPTGNQTQRRDAAGNTVKRTFDAKNQLVAEAVYLVAEPSIPATTRYAYDDRSRLRFVVSAEGRVTEHRYENPFGERTATINYTGARYAVAGMTPDAAPTESELKAWAALQDPAATQRVDMAYDGRGLLQTRTTYASVSATGAGVVDGSQSVETFVHDARGQLLKTVSPGAGTTSYVYDGLGRVLSTTDAAGAVTVTQYQDSGGRTAITLANGMVRTSVYDKAGRLVSVAESDKAGALLGEKKFFYEAGNRLRMTQDPTGVRNWILYDSVGRKSAEIDGDGTMTEFTYDASERVTYTVTYATAVNTALLVDATGQPVTSAWAGTVRPAASAADRREWRSYDAVGRLLRTASNYGAGTTVAVTENRYDGGARLLEVVQYATALTADGLGLAPGAIAAPPASADDRRTRNFHDGDGLLLGALDAEGYLTVFNYTGAAQLRESIRYATPTDATLRASGTLAQLTPPVSAKDQRTVHLYDGKGQRIGTVDAEGFLTEFIYDSDGNTTTTLRYGTPASAAEVTASSTLDALRANRGAARATSRKFDAFHRVLTETSPEGVRTDYSYDKAGNLVSTVRAVATEQARTLLTQYDLQGRLVGELSAEGAALLTGGQTQAQVDAVWVKYAMRHAYDAAGRRTSTTDALGHRTLFYYNADGALTHTIDALGEVRENRYDARGRLVEQYGSPARIAMADLLGGLQTPALAQALAPLAGVQELLVRYTYTSDDRVASEADAAGNTRRTTYNAFGDEVASTEEGIGAGLTLSQAYAVDHRGLRTSTTADPANASGQKAVTSTTYDAFGRAVRTIDANGNVRTQDFDRLGRLVTTRDATGAQRSTAYDAFDCVLTQTDAFGEVTAYAYDPATRAMTVTTPEGISTTTRSTRHGQVQSITDGKGQTTSYEYDRDGHLVRTITPLATTVAIFDEAGRQSDTFDANGVRTRFTYDAANRVLTRVVDPDGLKLQTSYAYDGMGRQITVTDPNGVVTMRAFDSRGRVLRETVDPSGLNLQTVYTYDARGNVLTVAEPGGKVTEYGYDVRGRRVKERVDPAGLNLTRTWGYDRNGNVVSSTDPLGNVTRYAYDVENRLVFTVDPAGGVRQNAYDVEGRVTMTIAYAAPVAPAAVSPVPTVDQIQALVRRDVLADLVERRVYDRDGRLLATLDGIGAVVRYAYDANGNVVKRTAYATAVSPGTPATQADIDAAVALVQNSARDAVVRSAYDAANRLTWSADGTGAVTQRVYDGNGNLVRQVQYATPVAATIEPSAVAVSAADRTTSMAYDSANRLVLTVDAMRGVTEQIYDGNGRVVRSVQYAKAIGSVPALGTAGTAAAIRNQLTLDVTADRVTRYAYDAAGRQVFAMDALGGLTESRYDAGGNVVAVVGYAKQANTFGLPAVLTLEGMRGQVSANGEEDRTTHYGYDRAGRLAFTVDPTGAVQSSQYDAAGRLKLSIRYAKRLESGFQNSPAGLAALVPSAISAGDQFDAFAYDAAGRLTSTTDALGATESSTYDALGSKRSFTNKLGSTWTYVYDAAGHLTSETTPLVSLATPARAVTGELVQATYIPDAIVTRLAYDALGNLTQRTEAAGRPEQRITGYEYDATGRQVRVIHPGVPLYDAAADLPTSNGATGIAARTETKAVNLETRTFYDALGNAVASIDVGGFASQKAYDLLGRVAYDVDAMGYVTGYNRNAFGDVTSLVRYAEATSLANMSIASASDAASGTFVDSLVHATWVDHTRDRTLSSTFDRAGRAIEVLDPVVFLYDATLGYGVETEATRGRTRNTYDAFGQLVQQQRLISPGTGTWATTTHYFDAAGHEVATLDAERYLTLRQFDAFGNVVEVKELANRASSLFTLREYLAPAVSSNDRRTVYAYDALNRMTAKSELYRENDGVEPVYLTTSFGYDALGNQTRVTDALGSTTTTKYDALGRVYRVWSPTRTSTVTGAALTPVTEFRRDVYGNVIVKVEYASSELSPSADDHYTVSAYDAHGHVTQTTDASGASVLCSYDAYGHVAKQWQGVTGNDGQTHTAFELYTYDALGRLVNTVTPASNSVYSSGGISIVSQTIAGTVTTRQQYNAFGEMTARKTGSAFGWQEYYDYDNAGRLWRTNSGDGVDRIYLYDGIGNVTGELRSAGEGYGNVDIRALSSAAVASAETYGYVRRVDMTYDAMGRMTSRKDAARWAGSPTGDPLIAGDNLAFGWLRPTVSRKLDRWGNILEITDPRSPYFKTTYRYNLRNQMVEQVQPGAAGGSGAVTSILYDAVGRQIAVVDANGRANWQVFDAGGNVVQELHADGGVVKHFYDAFGQKVRTLDAENRAATFRYDKMGRLLDISRNPESVYQALVGGGIALVSARAVMESWTYDQTGRKLSQTNGNNEKIKYTYDLRGNLVETWQPIGPPTRAAFDAQGRKTAEADANGMVARWAYDFFGQLQARYDLSGSMHEYTYDRARQLTKEALRGWQIAAYTYDAAGQQTGITDVISGKTSLYVYDVSGRKLRETVAQGGTTYQDNHLAYDALGRLRDVRDARVHVTMEYDAVGNRTRVNSTVNYLGIGGETPVATDRYFLYDEMNRQKVVDAVDFLGNLGETGHRLTYDRNGNRTSDTYMGNLVVETQGPFGVPTYTTAHAFTTEAYAYDGRNRLRSVSKDGREIDQRFYDGADRLVQSGPATPLSVGYTDALNAGLTPDQKIAAEKRIYRYDANGRLLNQIIYKSDGARKAEISWEAGAAFHDDYTDLSPDGYDDAGNVLSYVVKDHESGAIAEYTNRLTLGEGYLVSSIDGLSSKKLAGTTVQEFDASGFLVRIGDTTQPANNRTFVNDADGRALFVQQGAYAKRQLIVNGDVLGVYGVGVSLTDPASGLNNDPNFADIVDFDFTYSKVTASYPSASPGAYVVRAGDTLQAIAQQAYGDSSLWYRVAEANGLRSSTDMRAGQTLNIPNRISTINNNSTTFKPYDPSRMEGDKTPSLATPERPRHGGCGGVGKLLMVVVAVAVMIYLPGVVAGPLSSVFGVAPGAVGVMVSGTALSPMGAFVAGAIGGAVGSVASQVVGLATGTIDRFDWKGVALSAIGNGFTFGLQGGALGELGSNPAFRAAVTNATTQAIGVVTGLQKSFDWKGVAASAIGASVGQFVGEKLGLPAGGMGSAEFVAKATLQGIAAGTAAAIARGGRLAVQQVAVDAFGNALGQSIAEHAKPQGNPIYSLSSGENGVGLRGGASGDGMSYGGRRATVTADGSRQQGQSITTPDLDAGAVAALRENLGLPGHSPEEGWVLAAGPINGSSLGGYGPPLPVFGGPLTRQGANGTDESSAVLGATAGVAGSFGKMALGAAREGSNLIMQVGDLLTGGFNHDHPVMQQVWAEQRALGTRLVNLLENPVAAATDLIEGVVSRYEVSMSERTAFDRSYALGNLFNDVGQGAVGALFGLRGLVRFGADGMEFIAANALASGPVAGGRAAQFGAINPRSPRYQPGVASFGEDLLPASGRWLDAARPTPIPLQVARQLEGQSFKTFPELQAAIWRSIGSDPELSIGFSQQAIGQMSVGNAPFAPKAFQSAQFGARFNLHHIEPVATGGAVYDMSNIQIVAPRVHGGIHYPGRP